MLAVEQGNEEDTKKLLKAGGNPSTRLFKINVILINLLFLFFHNKFFAR